eukprot:CAMPEP_0114552990 /NCGR_PEP_ID=MMETSP0114-20121206/7417_1 /TAXON_ID=31324 /ORGANISM="Goniomonas sp, Strain m" /LENGTH=63 /DNA_ID=CAMNT_0001737899 /DNA_START=23 /DNA_END=210 /DNA_ORIENTATION=+
MYPVAASLILSPSKVAMPVEEVTVAVLVPPSVPLFTATVTATSELDVTVLPPASCSVTWGCVV